MVQKDIEKITPENQSALDTVCDAVFQKEEGAPSPTYALQKATRIAHVLLHIAEHVKDEHSLAKNVSEKAIAFLADVAESVSVVEARERCKADALALASLLDLFILRGAVSRDAGALLAEEVRLLLAFLSRHVWVAHTSLAPLSLSFQGFTENPSQNITTLRAQTARDYAEVLGGEPHIPQKPTSFRQEKQKMPQERARVLDSQKDRRARILGLLQTKPFVTVKDVAESVQGCSEKTLQRELLALVAQGVLKKEGERRWSTYTLA
jgi:hypothetical protein